MTTEAYETYIAADREIGLRGTFLEFIEMSWHLVEPVAIFQNNWHIECVAEHLEAVTRREIRKLLINIPPSCMKSLLVEVFWQPWKWIRQPGNRQISSSYDAGLTLRDARKTLQIVQSQWYRDRWGDICTMPHDVAAGDFQNLQGGFRYSTSVRGPMTGRHCDDFVVDDPVKPQDISPVTLASCNRWWHETTPTRFVDFKNSAKVIIMQRLHEGDLSGEVLKEDGWIHLRLPMRYEPKACSHTRWTGKGGEARESRDARMTEGELLWPDRLPEPEVKSLETDLGPRNTASQLQQRPSPEQGTIFQRSWFKYYTTPPARFDMIIQSWDCAFKDTDGSDYVCGQVWGARNAEYYLLDMAWERMDFPNTCLAVVAMTKKWPKAIQKLIEDKANGAAVISTLKKQIPGLVEVEPEGGKEARANAISGLYHAGNVYHPHISIAPWIGPMEEEMVKFPFDIHDDRVDACTQALLFLSGRTSTLARAMKNVRKVFG